MRRNMERDFAAAYCDDAGVMRCIAATWEEKKYLIDPHTAVAMDVLNQYRKSTGDHTPALVVSTASPFKFCPAVLEALGSQCSTQGLESIVQLEKRTGLQAPAPLTNLVGKPVRFQNVIGKDDMASAVRAMLE